MKTLRRTIAAMMIMLTSIAASAQPMSYYAMRNNARFLTDRMAYTLGLSAAILDELYLINYDYICGVNDYLDDVALGYRYDDYMEVVYARDYALRRLLTERQWARLMTYDYFYRPISFLNHRWSFSIYAYDTHINVFHFREPHRFNDYRGGHFFGGMRPMDRGGRPGGPGAGPMDRGGRPGDVRGNGQPGIGQPNAQAGGTNRNSFHIGEGQPNGQIQPNNVVNVNGNTRTSAQTATYAGGTRTTATADRNVNTGTNARVNNEAYRGSVNSTMPSTTSRSSATAVNRTMPNTTSRTSATSVNRNVSSTRSNSSMGSSTSRSSSSMGSASRSSSSMGSTSRSGSSMGSASRSTSGSAGRSGSVSAGRR